MKTPTTTTTTALLTGHNLDDEAERVEFTSDHDIAGRLAEGGDDLHIMIDRQGGRVHYRKNLQRMFGEMELKILRESPATSSYELKAGAKGMRLHFVVGADDRFLPVSLASMTSKYLRELLIGNINRYFNGFGADLKPTAGYWKDGLRFIEDIKTNLPDVRFDREQLIRSR